MTIKNPNLDLANINVYTNLVKFCLFIIKVLSGNKILTSIKGSNSVTNLRKMMIKNPNLDLVNINVYTKFGQILSMGSKDIERKLNSDNYQGQLLCYKFGKNEGSQYQPRSCQYQCVYKNLVRFCPFILKILSRKEILTSSKG